MGRVIWRPPVFGMPVYDDDEYEHDTNGDVLLYNWFYYELNGHTYGIYADDHGIRCYTVVRMSSYRGEPTCEQWLDDDRSLIKTPTPLNTLESLTKNLDTLNALIVL